MHQTLRGVKESLEDSGSDSPYDIILSHTSDASDWLIALGYLSFPSGLRSDSFPSSGLVPRDSRPRYQTTNIIIYQHIRISDSSRHQTLSGGSFSLKAFCRVIRHCIFRFGIMPVSANLVSPPKIGPESSCVSK